MKKHLNRLCILIGICLLVVAALLLIFWQRGIDRSLRLSENYTQKIQTLISNPETALAEEFVDSAMPVLAIDGVNFAGLLEIPRYGVCLPVCADWGAVTKYPCRLSGSVYNGTMQIGATSQKGQLDFYKEISVGDHLYFTDMAGNRFCYEVADIRYAKHADQSALLQLPAPLTLFIKNIYSLEYILISCNTLGQ